MKLDCGRLTDEEIADSLEQLGQALHDLAANLRRQPFVSEDTGTGTPDTWGSLRWASCNRQADETDEAWEYRLENADKLRMKDAEQFLHYVLTLGVMKGLPTRVYNAISRGLWEMHFGPKDETGHWPLSGISWLTGWTEQNTRSFLWAIAWHSNRSRPPVVAGRPFSLRNVGPKSQQVLRQALAQAVNESKEETSNDDH